MGLRINPQDGSDSDVKIISDELRRAIDAINYTHSPHSPLNNPLAGDTRELYKSVSGKLAEIALRIDIDSDRKTLDSVTYYLDNILDIIPPKAVCRFIEVDGRGTYRYTLGYGKAVANYDIAPEFLKGFKEMAYHFIKDVEQKKPISFLTDNSLILKQGNMLTADEACK